MIPDDYDSVESPVSGAGVMCIRCCALHYLPERCPVQRLLPINRVPPIRGSRTRVPEGALPWIRGWCGGRDEIQTFQRPLGDITHTSAYYGDFLPRLSFLIFIIFLPFLVLLRPQSSCNVYLRVCKSMYLRVPYGGLMSQV